MITNDRYVPCPLCGANNFTVRFPATKQAAAAQAKSAQYFCCTNSFLAQHGDIVQCRECGMAYNNPQPDPDELLTVYAQVQDPLYLQERGGREHTFRKSLRDLQAWIRPPGKLLDVGCYTGIFLETAHEAGWEVEGVELSAWAVEIARQANVGQVYAGKVEELDLPPHSFDVITLWDVLEHLPQPAAMFATLGALLKPGGILAFSTHLIDSLPARLLGTRYPFFMEMHVVHFSRKTLQRMLAEQGYRLLRIRPHCRVIHLRYFLEKLDTLIPFGHRLIRALAANPRLAERFISIRYSGLVNVFAQRL